jgi:DNA-binding winged helix-turn-helix (wHTH) protein
LFIQHFFSQEISRMINSSFRFGQWQVDPDTNMVAAGELSTQLEPRAMDVLRYLCARPNVVMPAEELLRGCWGDVDSGDNPLHKAIAQLRRALGDSSTGSRYIETIRKRGYRAIAEVVRDGPAAAGSWLAGSPFRGLQAFEEAHAAIFFGREQATAHLLEVTRTQLDAGCPMLLLLGPSGSGKTSLVRAGLLPRLMAQSASPIAPVALDCILTLDCADAQSGGPAQALASVLIDAELDGSLLFADEGAHQLATRLTTEPDSVLADLVERAPGLRIGLFVDRLEAIFRLTDASDDTRARFVVLLEQLARSGSVLLVIACRNDFYPDIVGLAPLMALKARGGHVDLCAPDGAELAQIVRQPARAAGLRFESDPVSGASLDDVLCDAARASPDALPLLQYCLDELYRQRSASGELRFSVYQQLGGIEGALGARAEQVIATLTPVQIGALPRVLAQLVNVAEDQFAVTARRAPWSSLEASPAGRELVRALVDARLFVSDLSGDVPAFGVAHEALLRRWPRLTAWIDQHRQSLQLRTRLGAQAARWDAMGRPRDLLLPRGSQVNQARELLERGLFALGADEAAFVRASVQRVRLAERLRLMVFGLVVALALLAAGLGLAARAAQRHAEQSRTDAEGLVGFMLDDFVDKLRPLGRLDLLDSVSARALTYLSAPDQAGNNGVALTQRAKALQLIAEVDIARANSGAASAALVAARAILQRQAEAMPRDKAVLKSLGANAFWLGQIAFDQGNWPEARLHFGQYSALSDRLARLDPDDPDGWIEQAYAHNSLGSVALNGGAPREAAREFSLSVALKTRALARRPGDQALAADLADSLSWLASTEEKLGRLAAAMGLYQDELALLRPLHEAAPKDALWTKRLANALSHQGELELAGGHRRAAQSAFEQARTLLAGIVATDRSNRAWQIGLHTAELHLLGAAGDTQDDHAALARLAPLQRQLEALLALEPKHASLTRLLAICQRLQGATYLRLGQSGKAREQFAATLATLGRLTGAAAADPTQRIRLADNWLLAADIASANADDTAAKRACRQAQAALTPAAFQSTDFHVLAPLVRAHLCTGEGAAVAAQQALLEQMSYREEQHLRYLATHPTKKGTS